MSEVPSDIQKLTFEKALAELEEIVDNLESGSTDLEKSIEFYTRGSHLKAHCQQKLDELPGSSTNLDPGQSVQINGTEFISLP